MDVCYDQKFCAYTGSHRKMLFKNGFTEKFCKIERKIPVMTLFLVKSHTLATLLKKTLLEEFFLLQEQLFYITPMMNCFWVSEYDKKYSYIWRKNI